MSFANRQLTKDSDEAEYAGLLSKLQMNLFEKAEWGNSNLGDEGLDEDSLSVFQRILRVLQRVCDGFESLFAALRSLPDVRIRLVAEVLDQLREQRL